VVIVDTARVDADVRQAAATVGPPRSPLAGLPSLIYHAADPLHGRHRAVETRAAPQGRRRPSFAAVAEMVTDLILQDPALATCRRRLCRGCVLVP
jgi:hypothetical protein